MGGGATRGVADGSRGTDASNGGSHGRGTHIPSEDKELTNTLNTDSFLRRCSLPAYRNKDEKACGQRGVERVIHCIARCTEGGYTRAVAAMSPKRDPVASQTQNR